MTRPRASWKRRVARALMALGGVLVLATAFIGFAHTKWGRPFLALMTGAKCPIGMDASLTPKDRDAARTQALASQWGQGAAPSKVAFGFVLGTTSRADVEVWATKNALTCKQKRAGNNLVCDGFPAAQLDGPGGNPDSARLIFDASDKLIGVALMRSSLDAEQAASAWSQRAASLAETFGAPTSARGEGTAAFLSSGPLRQADLEYRFADASVALRATNLGGGRVSLTEQMMIPPTS